MNFILSDWTFRVWPSRALARLRSRNIQPARRPRIQDPPPTARIVHRYTTASEALPELVGDLEPAGIAKHLRMGARKCPCSFPQQAWSNWSSIASFVSTRSGQNRRIRGPRRHPKALGTTSNLLSGSPSSIPCSRSDTCRANEVPSTVGCPAAEQSGRSLCPGISAKALLRST